MSKTAVVETVRHHRVHYFHVVRKFAKDEHGVDQLVREDLELVPERKDATRFSSDKANALARVWNAVAREA